MTALHPILYRHLPTLERLVISILSTNIPFTLAASEDPRWQWVGSAVVDSHVFGWLCCGGTLSFAEISSYYTCGAVSQATFLESKRRILVIYFNRELS